MTRLPVTNATRTNAPVEPTNGFEGHAEPAASDVMPRGTVTFLFTDLVGSTRLWARYPDVMPTAHARHDALLREAVGARHGVIYKVVGDALQVAFSTVADALLAAIAAQRALLAEQWPTAEALLVRMALHTCAAVPQPDGDYRTPALNHLARLLTAAHGGQILLTVAAADSVADVSLGTNLRDLGEHRLRDLEPEHIYQVVHPGLLADFPPLTQGVHRSHALPAQANSLIGREDEMAAAKSLLLQPDVRLLTLTGPGGTGKTRLSIAVAAAPHDDVTDGVFFIALAPIAEPDLVIPTIARELGVQEEAGRPLRESLIDRLRNRRLLLVLDNFEQVTAARSDIADLLAASPELKILVTSRAALRVRAEREFPVPPLTLPDLQRLPPAEQLSQYEAVRLFIDRAVAVKSDFALTNQNALAVAKICARLDGLPLAIELAAAWTKLLPPPALLVRLEQRRLALAGGPRDLPERQQTLRGAIAWSYDLLLAAEQALFRRLAVFVGGCSVEAAEAVATTGALAVDVFDGLAALVDKSLLRQTEGYEGEARFTMLETIREYGLEQLEASGEAELTRRAHAAHLLALAEEMSPLTWGSEQAHVLDRLEGELDNLRAAFAWALSGQETLLALDLGIHLEKLWDVRGYLSEGRDWLERASALPMDGVPGGPRAQALSNAGSIAQSQGDLDGARELQERALTILREVDTEGGRRGTAHVLNRLGIIVYLQGDIERAVVLQEDALARFRALDDKGAIAMTLNNLGVDAEAQGDYARARVLYEEALVLQREASDTQSIALFLSNLGGIARLQGDIAAAAAYHHESLLVWRELQDRWNTVATLLEVGRLAAIREKHESAARMFAAGEALTEAVGAPLIAREEERLTHERDVAAVRAALDASRLAAAWAAGRSLRLDEAITEALALTKELSEEAPNA